MKHVKIKVEKTQMIPINKVCTNFYSKHVWLLFLFLILNYSKGSSVRTIGTGPSWSSFSYILPALYVYKVFHLIVDQLLISKPLVLDAKFSICCSSSYEHAFESK